MQNKQTNTVTAHDHIARDMSPGDGASVLRENARLHQDNLDLKKRVVRGLAANTVLGAIFVTFIGAFLFLYPKYRFIPTLDNNAICEVYSNDTSKVTIATLTDYASDAAVNLNTYDYVNYQEQINATAAKWLSENGRKSFFKSLDESGNLERVRKGRLILKATKLSVAQVEEDGFLDGHQKYWIVQVPLMIEFYIGGEDKAKTRQEFLAAITVVQIEPSATNKKGISIDRITLSPYIRK